MRCSIRLEPREKDLVFYSSVFFVTSRDGVHWKDAIEFDAAQACLITFYRYRGRVTSCFGHVG